MTDKPEKPRAEPEIIPPDRSPNAGGSRGGWPPYGYDQSQGPQYGTQRVFVGRISPFGFALFMFAVGLFTAMLLLLLIGAAVIWIPVFAVLLVIAVISGFFRRR
jgi:hypothetical protein